MKRNKKIVLVSHCIINSNSKVEGLSQYSGIFKEFIDIITEKGIGMIQLPCPEMIVYGIRRWGHVKEQFDTLFYREQCREMLKPIIQQTKSYIDAGYEIIGIVGIDGSPSCGVDYTCSGDFRGEISNNDELENILGTLKEVKGSGVFIEELKGYLDELGIELPFTAINENDVYSSMDKIIEFI
ncbi:CD3072 family TudS-related putative desulfidase [Tissierella praeacuta]|uniref:CD3072 family TudS-related putative desulfidase n=1 Tax=Tissierella praeacuta TaxID=43131 RepID=UPI00333F2C19